MSYLEAIDSLRTCLQGLNAVFVVIQRQDNFRFTFESMYAGKRCCHLVFMWPHGGLNRTIYQKVNQSRLSLSVW